MRFAGVLALALGGAVHEVGQLRGGLGQGAQPAAGLTAAALRVMNSLIWDVVEDAACRNCSQASAALERGVTPDVGPPAFRRTETGSWARPVESAGRPAWSGCWSWCCGSEVMRLSLGGGTGSP